VTGGVRLLLGKPDSVGNIRVGAAAANSSITTRAGGVAFEVTGGGGMGSIASFFAEEVAEAAG
jgi:hypothetical protein